MFDLAAPDRIMQDDNANVQWARLVSVLLRTLRIALVLVILAIVAFYEKNYKLLFFLVWILIVLAAITLYETYKK